MALSYRAMNMNSYRVIKQVLEPSLLLYKVTKLLSFHVVVTSKVYLEDFSTLSP